MRACGGKMHGLAGAGQCQAGDDVEVRPVEPGMVEVGWRLARPYWGCGYASEAARAALEYGFTDVGLAEIVSFTVPRNERSWRVMERIGLIRDPSGDFDHPRVDPVAHPHLVRHVLYRLSREDWLALR